MPLFLSLLPQLFNLLPSIISLVQVFHGPTAGNGPTKLATAVGLAQQMVPALVPQVTGDPVKQKFIEDLISFSVKEMQDTGMMPQVTVPTVIPAVAAVIQSAVDQAATNSIS